MILFMPNPVFKSLSGLTATLFPENILDRIPADHPVRLVSSVVDQLDISSLIRQYKGGGTSSYHPRMMLKVLFYSYLSNVYSCRKIEKALKENIYFMWISGNSLPDFRTINHFRGKRLKGEIHGLFSEIVKILQELGYVSLDVQYIDGTKIESASNRYSFVWRKSVEKHKAKLEEKIEQVIGEIDAQIKSENSTPNEESVSKSIDSIALKEKLSELNKRLKKSEKADKAIQKQLNKLQKEHLPRLEKYETQLERLGDRNSYSKTDEDATFMRMKEDHMKNGQLKPAYNGQISTENQIITHFSIHQKPSDTTTLKPHIEGFEQQYAQQSNTIVADAGYGSEENYELLEENDITAYVKYNYFHYEQKRKFKNNPFLVPNMFYNAELDFYVCPMGQRLNKIYDKKVKSSNGYVSTVSCYQAQRCQGCPMRSKCHKAKGNRIIQVNHRLNELKAQARELLHSEQGLKHRSKRPIEPEAVFGQLKYNNKFTRFTLKGLEKVNIEFALMAIGHNLRKMKQKLANTGKNRPFKVLMNLSRSFRAMANPLEIQFDYFLTGIANQTTLKKLA